MNKAIPERQRPAEEISGLIERVTFFNEETGFCVLRVRIKGQREVTVVGSLPAVTAGGMDGCRGLVDQGAVATQCWELTSTS
jgi:exodeoxyribonuclease V alpha subunit